LLKKRENELPSLPRLSDRGARTQRRKARRARKSPGDSTEDQLPEDSLDLNKKPGL